MNNELRLKEKYFVEEVGLFFEQSGMPRMAGRILGWLLLSDPPHQSLDELAEALMASKGSISTTTRLLIQVGLIERISLPGVRRDYFRIRPGAFQHSLKQGVERVTILRKLAERGLELLEGKAPLTRQGLEEMRDMYVFFEREYPALLERWEQRRREKQATSEITR
ncbi:MAG: MarR family transcriptional regulator [Dehalococcoidales bacterium]|jgi:DNA-binding transcriptional regulator GbsR (MarR family)|nr:MarR family transcriptional regulator [Dehalococcoidales bacterium]|tara:strand:- start:1862 stop:2359 length:498 start_codon:yes stop_codon:yes gene_type:complete